MYEENQVNDLKDFKEKNGDNWLWDFWRNELNASSIESKDYFEEAEAVINIFKAKFYTVPNAENYLTKTRPAYNILYSNVETLKPLLFSRLPNPKVRKRNLEKNNINKLVSIVLERNIKRILEETEAQSVIENARDDFLLTKRGIVKVLYEQEIEVKEREERSTNEKGEETIEVKEYEELGEKKISLEYVNYQDIRFSRVCKWEDITWVAFRHFMTKDKLKKRFGRKSKEIILGASIESNENQSSYNQEEKEGQFKKAEVWEIWDKESKKVYFFSAGYKKGMLATIEDNYNLTKFFNIPRPLGIDSGYDKVNVPIPDYRYYKDQAQELDRISNRIMAIIPYISMGGLYSDTLTSEDAQKFLKSIDSYSPIRMPMGTDIEKLIKERDITKLTNVLTTLYAERQQVIASIQEITGISDIVRGQTQAQETATAQELKGNFAISRLQPMQQEIQFFCRDIIRIIAELIAENYDIVELVQGAGLKVFDIDEMTEKFTLEAEQQGLNPEELPSYVQSKLKPYLLEIKSGQATSINNMIKAAEIMKSDKLRGWSIEVETDSTIKLDQNAEKQAVLEFSNSLATVASQFMPLVQANVITKDAFKSLLSYVMRRFEGSEEVEELLDDNEEQATNQAEQMQMQMMQKQAELEERKVAAEEYKVKTNAELQNKKLDIDESKAILNAENFADEMQMKQENLYNTNQSNQNNFS